MEYNTEYQRIIEKLQLEPHPEGGYYRQLFGNDDTGKKAMSFLNKWSSESAMELEAIPVVP